MTLIIGRQKELRILDQMNSSTKSEFIALYGRRRIGKTFLITEYFKQSDRLFFEMTGTLNAPIREQLENFRFCIEDVFKPEKTPNTPKTWIEAFRLLKQCLDEIGRDIKTVLFFDEIPWLATKKSGFLRSLDHFWNRYTSRNKNVLLVICGSASSWIIDNIINDKGGMHGRVTRQIHLLPFTLKEASEYLSAKGVHYSIHEVAELYMALGGVAKYLDYAVKGSSPAQIINDTCFKVNGDLHLEFNRLYRSLFYNYDIHLTIVKELANHLYGVTQKELIKRLKLSAGGNTSNIFKELEESGFIAKIPEPKAPVTGYRYILIDEYTLFYLKWIKPGPKFGIQSTDSNYWFKKQSTQAYKIWSGFVFELLCLKHIDAIKEALHIGAVSTTEYRWYPQSSRSNQKKKSAQIDLVIDRADNCVNLCECKFYNSEYVLTQEYARQILAKRKDFMQRQKHPKTAFNTLITSHGVKKNNFFNKTFDNSCTLKEIFGA